MGDETPSRERDPPTRDEVEDLVANLFDDFSDNDEPSPATAKQAAPGSSDSRLRPTPEAASESPIKAEDGPKKKRRKVESYFDTEAVEAGASEDEDEGAMDDIIDDSAPMDGQAKAKQKAELDRLQEEMDERHFSGGTVRGSGFLKDLEERARAAADDEDEGINLEDIGKVVPTQSVVKDTSKNLTVTVPDSSRDPRLWCIKTFAPERELILSLLLKAGECSINGKECPIFSAFYNPALRGYIYVEAHKENDIRAFSKGIRGISPWQIKLVPVGQMPQVFSAAVTDSERKDVLKEGDWIRMKRGIYANDLAQIEEIVDEEYVVKMKPRLDYSQSKLKLAREDRASKKRPAAKWFNRADVEAAGMVINPDRRFGKHGALSYFLVDGEIYRDGFYFKKVKSHYFISGETVRPSEHELQDWANRPVPSSMTTPERDLKKAKVGQDEKEEEDRKLMPPPTSLPGKRAERLHFEVDDIVIVTYGDLMNMKGTVVKAFPGGPTVLVRPLAQEGIKEAILSISVDRLSKYFVVGDHVKVFAGPNKGASGYIVQVNLRDESPKWGFGATATLVSVVAQHHADQCEALINHMRISVERSAPSLKHGEFEVGRCAKFGAGVCLITRIEANSRAIVLDMTGQPKVARFDEMEPIESNKDGKSSGKGTTAEKAWTADRKGNRILVNDIVRAAKGKGPNLKCQVLWIYGGFLFLKATEALSGENAYIVTPGASSEFVVRDPKREERIKEKQRKEEERVKALEEDKSDVGVFGTDIRKASDTSFVKDWFKKLMGLPVDPKSTGLTKEHIGKTVKITGGAYKGLRAEVRDVLGSQVRLSLLAKPKLVLVDMANLARDDYTQGGVKNWLNSRDEATNKRNNAGEVYNPQPTTPEAPNVVPQSPGNERPDDADDLPLALRETDKDDKGDADEWDPSFGVSSNVES